MSEEPTTSANLTQFVFSLEEDDLVLETRQPPTINDQLAQISQKIRSLETVTAEISQRVRALETVLEANTKQLAETTNQVARMTAFLELFVKGKAKDVAVEVAFPVTSEEDLVALELNISSGSKERYMESISHILKRNNLQKAINGVVSDPFLCTYNIDGLNGKKIT
ncbi:uncharacterized protein LOC122625807 [Drosophila teissieri]|uniref:uncharacterized protein LOC122625807 n=1 Tax=Drosophila teissieri TaxID=7243 RepID=UPI001CBA3CA9|nr:uncharacterized protein LOC122625807 [Drosophila teissieri]XP_043661794.1 uncharacterized protein LOC122625807 [Drosophila teissieri]XP_043661795.1 uncharacterized protein LOC122625807 [Drosophila teissieri]